MPEAIIVVDVQNGFVSPASVHIPDRIKALLEQKSFEHRVFSRFSNPCGSQYEKLLSWTQCRSSPETDIVSTLSSYPTLVIDKHIYSCVSQEFLDFARANDLSEFYVCGVDTDICVLKTCVDLFEHGYRPILLSDCCMSHAGTSQHQAALEILPRFIGHRQIILDTAQHFGISPLK